MAMARIPFLIDSDDNGVLYGATLSGGTDLKGTVFSLTPPSVVGGLWTERILFDFASSSNPSGYNAPLAGLAIDKNGVLYGTTKLGGGDASCLVMDEQGCGAVFSLTPPAIAGGDWTFAILHAFNLDDNNGAFPGLGFGPIGKNGVL